jgi:hypothetical protein
MAKRRDAVDVELAAFEQRLDGITQIATADASAVVLSDISGTTVSEHELPRRAGPTKRKPAGSDYDVNDFKSPWE